jgi:hypothetical protein
VFRINDNEVGPSNSKEINAVTLRSGKNLTTSQSPPGEESGEDTEEEEELTMENQEEEEETLVDKDTFCPTPPTPFPEALRRKGKKSPLPTQELEEFFQNIIIHLPLLKALEQVPAYARFLKEKCTPKRKPRAKRVSFQEPLEKHALPVASSNAILHRLPTKKKDPGAPLVTCTIGTLTFERTLLDDGASINLIPSSIIDQFDIGPLEPVDMTLQLADRSVKRPKGILEDVIVTVQGHQFPVDFVVLDMDVPANIAHTPIILGRPFLATARAMINCTNGSV